MPPLFPNIIRRRRFEADDHQKIALAGMHPETVLQEFRDGKVLGAREGGATEADRLHPGGDEGPDVPAQMVESEEEPFPVDVGQVIGIDETRLDLASAGLAVAD